MAGFSLFSLSFRVSTTWASECIHIDLVKLSLYESLQPGQAYWCMFSLLTLESFRLRSLTGELSPSRWSRVCLYILSSPGKIWDLKSLRTVPRLTSNMKCGYTVVPAGCCPEENLIALKVRQSPTSPCSPSSTSCLGSIWRASLPSPGQQFATGPYAKEVRVLLSSINAVPDCAILRVFCQLEDMESNVDKAYVGGQLQQIYNLHVLI